MNEEENDENTELRNVAEQVEHAKQEDEKAEVSDVRELAIEDVKEEERRQRNLPQSNEDVKENEKAELSDVGELADDEKEDEQVDYVKDGGNLLGQSPKQVEDVKPKGITQQLESEPLKTKKQGPTLEMEKKQHIIEKVNCPDCGKGLTLKRLKYSHKRYCKANQDNDTNHNSKIENNIEKVMKPAA